jgi:hypothetical protein
MSQANYDGKQPNNTAYIKRFTSGTLSNLWKVVSYTKSDNTIESAITTANQKYKILFIKGDLFVEGNIVNPSDINLKNNIEAIKIDATNKIMDLKPSQFTFKNDSSNNIHYGFIAQEFENEYPELVYSKPDVNYSNMKGINYLEIIPLLVHKIQLMQEEIDMLKTKI